MRMLQRAANTDAALSPRELADRAANGEKKRLGKTRLPLVLLVLSDDAALLNLVRGNVEHPWELVRQSAARYLGHFIPAPPNVRLVILDDQEIADSDHGRLLRRIGKHFSGHPLLYVASSHSDDNEKRARTNGAQYYVCKPLPHERFIYVLQSFLQSQQIKG